MTALTVEQVSVIIVNYNGENVLPKALSSLKDLAESPLEVVVVDNGSSDHSVDLIKEFASNDPKIRLIALGSNLGVAGGRNVGVEVATGEIWAFLDADGRALPDWLAEALKVLNGDQSIGAVAPLVLMDDGHLINGAGSFLDRSGHGRDRFWGETVASLEPELVGLSGEDCDYAMGCGMVIRRDGLESLWPLDEDLLKWHDDTEIGIRIRRLGYRTVFWAPSRVLHDPGHSDPRSREARHLQAEKARFRLLVKYYPLTTCVRELSYYLLHAASGSRRRPQALLEAREVLSDLRQSWRHLISIRRQWRKRS